MTELFSDSEAPIPLEAQIKCVEREISMRVRVYGRWLQEKRITQQLADRELAQMRAVLATLQSLKEKNRQ